MTINKQKNYSLNVFSAFVRAVFAPPVRGRRGPSFAGRHTRTYTKRYADNRQKRGGKLFAKMQQRAQ